MKVRRRPVWLQALSLSTLIFLAGYTLVSLKTQQQGGENAGRPTTHSAGTRGYKALYLWLKSLGIKIERWEKPLSNLPSGGGVLLVIEPETAPSEGELKALGEWVRSGGVLFLLATQPNPFMKRFGFEFEDLSPQEPEREKEKIRLQPGPYVRGGIQIESRVHPGLTSPLPETVFHARNPWGNLLGVMRQGKGRVVAMADPQLFSNQSLGKGDHALLALDLILTHLGEGTVMVDEYHHGYGKATTILGHLLGSSSALALFLQGVAVLLLLWASWGRRFGSPRPLLSEEHRRPMEYERAMAHLYHRGEKRREGLAGLLRWVEEEARRLLLDRDPCVKASLHKTRQKIEQERLSEREFLGQARDLYQALERAKTGVSGNGGGTSLEGEECRQI